MNDKHELAAEDRLRIERFLCASARYFGLAPQAGVIHVRRGTPNEPPAPWRQIAEEPAGLGRRAVGM